MKKIIACCAAALLFILCGCNPAPVSSEPTPQVTETAPVKTQAPAITPAPTEEGSAPEPSPEEKSYDGELLFSVSEIVFSLQGESEDIYLGTIPREAVTWTSDDESVAVFRDGVLTAVGVGSTTVYAEYGDQRGQCAVRCLAETQEELDGLAVDILRSPKRYPPAGWETPNGFFADAAIVGDSITYIMFQHETRLGTLGHPLFLVRGGTGIHGVLAHTMDISYRGQAMAVEDALAESGVNKVFIMLGQNDLGWRSKEDTLESLDTLVGNIRGKCPEIEIYLESILPEWSDITSDNSRSVKIAEYDEMLKSYAAENGCSYVDIAPYIADHTGRMATMYSLGDDIHLNEDGCVVWMRLLNFYGYLQELGGNKP